MLPTAPLASVLQKNDIKLFGKLKRSYFFHSAKQYNCIINADAKFLLAAALLLPYFCVYHLSLPNFTTVPGLDAQGELQNSAEKSSLYQKGDELLRTGHTDEALMCFLASLKGLKESNTFQELPQCLHQVFCSSF